MAYIIMALDECGSEFRPDDRTFPTMEAAETAMWQEVSERYPEHRGMWVEAQPGPYGRLWPDDDEFEYEREEEFEY